MEIEDRTVSTRHTIHRRGGDFNRKGTPKTRRANARGYRSGRNGLSYRIYLHPEIEQISGAHLASRMGNQVLIATVPYGPVAIDTFSNDPRCIDQTNLPSVLGLDLSLPRNVPATKRGSNLHRSTTTAVEALARAVRTRRNRGCANMGSFPQLSRGRILCA